MTTAPASGIGLRADGALDSGTPHRALPFVGDGIHLLHAKRYARIGFEATQHALAVFSFAKSRLQRRVSRPRVGTPSPSRSTP